MASLEVPINQTQKEAGRPIENPSEPLETGQNKLFVFNLFIFKLYLLINKYSKGI